MVEAISKDRKQILDRNGVPEETAAFLDKIKLPILQEWAYLCAAEGIMKDSLDQLCEKAAENLQEADTVFMDAREKFLRLKYENNKDLKEQFLDLKNEVQSMYRRASHVESSFDETIKKTLRDKDELYVSIIESKNEMIREKDHQLKDLKEGVKSREDRIHFLEDRIRTLEVGRGHAKKTDPPERDPADHEKKEKPVTGSSGKSHPQERVLPDPVLPVIQEPFYPVQPGRRFFNRRKDREAELFIRQFMENTDYNDEQKEFLIQCLEQGDPVEFIREYASPKLSVGHMAWLRKIVGGRKRYGR